MLYAPANSSAAFSIINHYNVCGPDSPCQCYSMDSMCNYCSHYRVNAPNQTSTVHTAWGVALHGIVHEELHASNGPMYHNTKLRLDDVATDSS
jgi:hypothetical protein